MTTFIPRTNYVTKTPSQAAAPWCETDFLAVACRQAVANIDETRLIPVITPDARFASQSKPLLALLTYCYARQIYSSAKISDRMGQDQSLKEFCDDELPNAGVLRIFRDSNRESLRCCLERVLSFSAAWKVMAGFVTRVDSRHLADEARRRLVMAAFEDRLHTEIRAGTLAQP
jgi:hypothetical protein